MTLWSRRGVSVISVFFVIETILFAHDRYLFWERSDFRFFRRIPFSVHIVWLHTVHFHSRQPYYSYFHEFSFVAHGIARYFVCIHFYILATRYTTRRLLVKFLQNYNEVFFFTSIDRQNVNAQISQTAQSVNNFYSTKMTSDYLPRRFSSLLFNSVPKWRGFF